MPTEPITPTSVWGSAPQRMDAYVINVHPMQGGEPWIMYRSFNGKAIQTTTETAFRALYPVHVARTVIE